MQCGIYILQEIRAAHKTNCRHNYRKERRRKMGVFDQAGLALLKKKADRNLAKLAEDDPALAARYEALKQRVVYRKNQFQELMVWLEARTAWTEAPASIKYHLNKPHGLLEHSVNVAEALLALRDTLEPDVPDESCVIVGLLHDLGKAGVEGKPQYIENEPSEKQKSAGYPASTPYKFNNDMIYLSVPIRSLYLILPRLKLSEEEAQAIVYHDGQYVEDNRSVATKEEKLTLLLQYADNWSGFVKEME